MGQECGPTTDSGPYTAGPPYDGRFVGEKKGTLERHSFAFCRVLGFRV